MSRRAWYITFVIIWILSLPLTILLVYIATRISGPELVRDTQLLGTSRNDIITKLLVITALWSLFYMFLGWIPLIVIHTSKPKGGKR